MKAVSQISPTCSPTEDDKWNKRYKKDPSGLSRQKKHNTWNETSISRVRGLDTEEVTPQSTMICCALSLQHSFTPGPMHNCGFNAHHQSSWQPTVWHLRSVSVPFLRKGSWKQYVLSSRSSISLCPFYLKTQFCYNIKSWAHIFFPWVPERCSIFFCIKPCCQSLVVNCSFSFPYNNY